MPVCKLVSAGSSGESLRDLVEYIQNPAKTLSKNHFGFVKTGKEESVLAIGNVLAVTPVGIINEMRAYRDIYREYHGTFNKRWYLHFIIAYSHKDSNFTPVKVLVIHLHNTMHRFLENAQWTASLHQDKKHKHWHIIVNIIDINGKLINTNNIFNTLREISDRSALECGLSVIDTQKTVIKNNWNYENNKKNKKVILRDKINSLLKITLSKNLLSFKNELKQAGIYLQRSGPDGGLVYLYEDKFYKASDLGNLMQLYGIKCVQNMGYENAIKHIKSIPRSISFRFLNAASVCENYFYLEDLLMDKKIKEEDIEKRKLFSIASRIVFQVSNIDEYKYLLSLHGIEVLEDKDKFTYIKDKYAWPEKKLNYVLSKQKIKNLISEKDSGEINPLNWIDKNLKIMG